MPRSVINRVRRAAAPRTLDAPMAWDFSTEPEFQAQLDWMRGFVREEIWPLETLDLDRAQLDRALRAAAGAGARARAVGGAPAARARRPGLRPGQARAHARDPRLVAARAERLRQPGAGLRQLRAHRARRQRGAEGPLAAPAAGRRPALGVLDDRARHRRRRPDDAADARGARRGRRRVGHRRPQVVLVQRARSPTSSSSWRSPTPTPGRTSARR